MVGNIHSIGSFLFYIFSFFPLCVYANLSHPVSSEVEGGAIAEVLKPGLQDGSIRLVEFPGDKNCLNGREIVFTEACQNMAKNRGYHFLTKEEPKALLLVSHGMQGHSAWFHSGIELARNGIEVLAFDRYGSGISDGNRGSLRGPDSLFQELDAANVYLVNERKDIPLHLHSNCFSNRIVIPYIENHMKQSLGYTFTSIINTSPATHMSEAATALYMQNKDCLTATLLGRSWSNCSSEESLEALQNSNKDNFGIRKINSPLEDELFTSNQDYLSKLGGSEQELRELSLNFLLKTHQLSNFMEEMLKGSLRSGDLEKEGSFQLPLLMILFNRDKIVRNKDIVKEYFAPYPAYNITESQDIVDKCNFCNPWVIGLMAQKDRNRAICKDYNLSACNYESYMKESCTNQSILDSDCSSADQVQKEKMKNLSMVKKLVEINCEHAVEFCEKKDEVQRYRQAIIDWLLKDQYSRSIFSTGVLLH